MNKSIFFTVLVTLMAAAAAGQQIWSYCPGNINAEMTIGTISIVPTPPKIGQPVTVSMTGTLNTAVTSGQSTMTVEYYIAGQWRALPEFQNDVCSILSCPVAVGPISFNTTITVPFITPRGQYRGTFELTDQNNNNITCLNFATTLNP
eukprot:gene15927-18933_t